MVRPKKSLGQHFLKDPNIARKIVASLEVALGGMTPVLEVGPGTGVLTRLLLGRQDLALKAIEIDREAAVFLRKEFPKLDLVLGDFLEEDMGAVFPGSFKIIGNFPYNISSQILFKVLDHRDRVDEVVGMLQKEVADRIAAKHGNKVYGILSVLLQAFYDIEYLFKVSPGVFNPPPKVMSAVIRLKRNSTKNLDCDEALFQHLVKQAFQKRRKTLRNALKHLNLPRSVDSLEMMSKRPEQLSVQDFIFLTRQIEQSGGVRRV